MTSTLDLTTLIGNLFDYWELNFPHDVVTAYPGIVIDTQNLAEWVDLELNEFSRCIGRDSSPPRGDIVLKVNLFVRRSTDFSRINRLANTALAIFTQTTIPLYAPDSTELLLGYAQMLEGHVQNHTRHDREVHGVDLQRVTITVKGIVQEVSA